MPADLPDEEVVVVKVLPRDDLAVEEQPEVPRPRPPLVRVLELVTNLLGQALGVPVVQDVSSDLSHLSTVMSRVILPGVEVIDHERLLELGVRAHRQ